MKKDWTYKKLGEVTKIKTGKLDANASSEDGIYPFFTCSKEPLRISSYSYDCECVLVAGNGDLNVKYYKGKFDAYQRTYIIETTPDSGVMTYYMYHFFNKYIETLRQKSIGGIIKYIKLGDLTEATIPVPPISVQESIVRELDAIHGILEKKQEQLRELDNLAQAIFYDMFGDPLDNDMNWDICKLGDLSIKIANGYNAKLEKDTYKTEGVPYFRCQNIWWNRIDFDDIVYIDDSTNEKMKASSLMKNDLIISKIGRVYTENSSLGRTAMYEGEDRKANISGNLCFVRLNNTVVPRFILHILTLEKYRKWAMKNTPGGIDKRAMSVGQISGFPIILPPLSLQQSFAAKIEAIEAQKQTIQQSIREVEALLAERMDHYFS